MKSIKAILISITISVLSQGSAMEKQGYQKDLPSFSKIPTDVQAYIFSYLDQGNFLKASQSCHEWRTAAFKAGENKSLTVSKRKLDQADCQVLLDVPFCGLSLYRCQLGNQVIFTLSQNKRLKKLYLGCSNIGDKGLKELANGNLINLITLSVHEDYIGEEGLKELANGNLTELNILRLDYNTIGDKGGKELLNGNLTRLNTLDLGYNNIGKEVKEFLKKNNPLIRINF